MASFSRSGVLGGLTLVVGASVLAGVASAQDVIYVPAAPPPPRAEIVPTVPADRVVTWQPGYWRWTGAEYAWVAGHYVDAPRRGAVWIPGRWEQRARGWVYVDGHWN
ncbi:YXWGXW repeat-containing protein [Enhydrobacter aerosaccus]|uniref:YXWGXW repeat-containing protein n=1 Tax=Enhydrobacter aerosaccus TaxID=225324 RepID=A0A1T4PQM8_9HYPH|nr:YXWGXW repeat-containing protein [Enhydrobacter aerosaccus]SJZ93833.1 YXWGXW repeat-containing protein [Enhydrobacter aerosaccus]